MTQRTNDEWLADLRPGNPQQAIALEDLRSLLVNGLRWGLSKWIDTRGPEFEPLAEDFTQEALLKILDNIDSFRGESKFTTWAHKIAIRVGLTELRRKRWRDVSLESLLETEQGDILTPSFMADAQPGPSQLFEQTDMVHRVQRVLLEELTDKQRTAMIATQIRGMPMDEVARRMDMNRNALYKLLHDARLRLKERLMLEGLTSDEVLATFE